MEHGNRVNTLLNRSLAALPSPFARLAFVASLRDPYTGRYLHEGWATVASTGQVHRAVAQTHLSLFEEVLALPLEQLCGQLHEHFGGWGGSDREMAKQWLAGEPFRDAIPDGSSILLRKFFLSQMRAALWLLVYSATLDTLPERYASQLQPPVPQFPHRQGT